jgi:hypothetical protein
MSMLKTLLEIADKHHLTASPEFKAIQQASPKFAQNLITAWDGDAKDYEKANGKAIEFLFPKLLDEKAIKKFAPTLEVNSEMKNKLAKLKHLHLKEFPAGRKVDKSVWAHEPWARESLDLDADYAMLREELSMLEEGKMAQLDQEIRNLFNANKRKIIKIDKPSIHTFKDHSGSRQFVVHPITFVKDDGKETSTRHYPKREIKKQEYQDYVYHPVGSLDVKLGLPKKKGGETLSIK